MIESTPPPAPPRPRKSVKGLVLRGLVLAVAAALLFRTLRGADLGRAASLVRSVGAPIILVLFPYLVGIVLHVEAFRRILGLLGRPVPLSRLLPVVLSTEALMMSVPAGVAVSGTLNPYLLLRRCGVPIPDGLASLGAKKALVVLSNALYAALALAVGFGALRRVSTPLLGFRGLEWIVAASALALFTSALLLSKAFVSGQLAGRSHGLLSRLPFPALHRWLDARKAGFLETDRRFAVLFRERRASLLAGVALLLGMWLAEAVETLVILRLLHVALGFPEVLSLEVVVVMLRSLAFLVPGALGVLDAGYVAFLLALGVPEAATVGVVFVLIKRMKELVFIAVGYLALALMKDAKASPEPAPSP
jgi:glycosyltransferase 2 family protein